LQFLWGQKAGVKVFCAAQKRRCTVKKYLRFLITAGPTREAIDPVRFISNRSSGKMGYALAAAARKVSPHVTLVSGPTCLQPPRGVRFISVVSADEMARAVFAHFPKSDVVIMAAAVADFRPKVAARRKWKKNRGAPRLQLAPTVDILRELGRRKTRQFLMGFAAETDSVEANAMKKLRAKRLDMLVANDVSQKRFGMESDYNQVTILYANRRMEKTRRMTKPEVARLVLRRCLEQLAQR
jgi:phosphopantothenoylcysteine decarboxylase/phosphopantothenate--cysteine ligase